MKNQKYIKINISIGDLFNKLNIDNNKYEEVQKIKENIYVKNLDNTLVPILGYVKKRVNLVKYTFDNGNELVCSDKHLVLNENNETVNLEDKDLLAKVVYNNSLFSTIIKILINPITLVILLFVGTIFPELVYDK